MLISTPMTQRSPEKLVHRILDKLENADLYLNQRMRFRTKNESNSWEWLLKTHDPDGPHQNQGVSGMAIP